MLSEAQQAAFWRDGYVVTQSGIATSHISVMRSELDRWTERSRTEKRNFGSTVDGKARFDLGRGHCASAPVLRRVANPVDISAAYRAALFEGTIVTMVVQLIGPDVAFHHCKLNIKTPGSETHVDYHQDHAFDPHSNDDVVVALLMLDDMGEHNGCLRVVPGSHRGPRYSHFSNGRFVGRLSPEHEKDIEARSVSLAGRMGDLILMHTWTVHGGPPNFSGAPRRMLICDYTAADAVALSDIQLPSRYTGRLVAGKRKPRRTTQTALELPPKYSEDSFFGVQGQRGAQ